MLALEQVQIQGACYTDCEQESQSNPEYKACLARAADTADALLNQEFQSLQQAVKSTAQEMGVRPEAQLGMLREAQRRWIAFRDEACSFEDGLAFGATAMRRHSLILYLRLKLSAHQRFRAYPALRPRPIRLTIWNPLSRRKQRPVFCFARANAYGLRRSPK